MLYRLLKKVCQSFRTFFSVSDSPEKSDIQSSGLSDERPRARFGSLPAKTDQSGSVSKICSAAWKVWRTVIPFPRSISFLATHVKDVALERH
jgi:hypothetical protein